MRFESDGKDLFFVVTEPQDSPRNQKMAKRLEGSGWECPPPGTRFKLPPETIDWYLQHTNDPNLIEFLLRHKTNAQNSLS